MPFVVLQFTANTNLPRCELCSLSAQAHRQFFRCCLATSLPVNITIGGDWNIVMIVPVLEGSGTKKFLIQMRLVDVGELHAMHREGAVFVKESSLPIRWLGMSKTPLKKC